MAYAAVTSLMQTIDQTLRSDRFHVLEWEDKLRYIKQKADHLQTYLESSWESRNEKSKHLETRMKHAIREAEDMIELHASNLVHSASDESCLEQLDQVHLDLDMVIEELERVVEQVDNISQENCDDLHDSSPRKSSPVATNIMVGFEKDLEEIKGRLIGGSDRLRIFTITGMAGIGKTALAENVYHDPLIVSSFDIRVWANVSREYNFREIVLDLVRGDGHSEESNENESTERLAERAFIRLRSSRFLVVMDDVWDTWVWEDVGRILQDNKKGSRVILTSRLSYQGPVAYSFGNPHQVQLLDEETSWSLLEKTAFSGGSCPSELHMIGKTITKKCGGLPLALVTIGAYLSKGDRTRKYWDYVAENVSDILMSDDQQSSKSLSSSYKYLPPYLKACFLYLSIFPENYEIRASKLVKLWVAEGFVKPVMSVYVSLEDVARQYIEDLVVNNLVMVRQVSHDGKVKSCIVHDHYRSVCAREAGKERFLHVFDEKTDISPAITHGMRSLGIHRSAMEDDVLNIFDAMKSMSLARSFLFSADSSLPLYLCFRLLRILDMVSQIFYTFPLEILDLVNLRYLAFNCNGEIPSSISVLWSLQTIFAPHCKFYIRFDINKMSQLRHLLVDCELLLDGIDLETDLILESLQTLSLVHGFRCSEAVVRAFPNLRKLGISYDADSEDLSHYHLNNLARLQELKILKCYFVSKTVHLFEHLKFPGTLKQLTLSGSRIPWKETRAIGALPYLEVLKLLDDAFEGSEWETDIEFPRLKYLKLENMSLVQWRVLREGRYHFPCLQQLVLHHCSWLEEVPTEVGKRPTLEVIELHSCSKSASQSAKKMLKQRQARGNDSLRVHDSNSQQH